MSNSNEDLIEAMAKPGNDTEFKKHVLRKLITLEKNQVQHKSDFKIFKLKAFTFIAALVGVKDQAFSYFSKFFH